MPKGMQPIYTQTVTTVGGVASITFNNIPQTFTDLVIMPSFRATTNGGVVVVNANIIVNGDTASTAYSINGFGGNGSSTYFERASSQNTLKLGFLVSSIGTANYFSTNTITVGDYTSTKVKPWISETCTENNATANWTGMYAGIYRSSLPITKIAFTSDAGNIAQNSTITLYGIGKA